VIARLIALLLALGVFGGGLAIGRASAVAHPLAPEWTVAGELSRPRAYARAVAVATGEILVLGGMDPADPRVSVGATELFDPATGEVTVLPQPIVGRLNQGVTIGWGDRVVVTGGTEWLAGAGTGPKIRFTEDVEDSMRINAVRSGAVIISASGMCEGGRIKHHLKYNLPRRECAIVFVGFQAAGTLGRRIVDGAKSVRLFGEQVPVRAKVFTIGGLSAHADRSALLGWLAGLRAPPRQTWVVHGEPQAAHALRDEIERRLHWRAAVPAPGQTVEIAS